MTDLGFPNPSNLNHWFGRIALCLEGVWITICGNHSRISQKPPLSGPTRRRYLPRMASILRHTDEGCSPNTLPKSILEIYGSSSISCNILIRLSDKRSPFKLAFSITRLTLPVKCFSFSVRFSSLQFAFYYFWNCDFQDEIICTEREHGYTVGYSAVYSRL